MLRPDPNPYDGPIAAIDGTRPYNMYLWPTECWAANAEPRFSRVPFDFRIAIVALADGRFSVTGSVYVIEAGSDINRQVVFSDRSAAIRASAAATIRLARRCIRDDRWASVRARDCRDRLPDVIQWIREVVARETECAPPQPFAIRLPPPPRPRTGMPLFDFGGAEHP